MVDDCEPMFFLVLALQHSSKGSRANTLEFSYRELVDMRKMKRADSPTFVTEETCSLSSNSTGDTSSKGGESDNNVLGWARAIPVHELDTPRFACVLLRWEFEQPEGLSPDEQSPSNWIRRLKSWQAHDLTVGESNVAKEERLFLVCAHTFRLVPCGKNGQGYGIRTHRWVRDSDSVRLSVLHVMKGTLDAMSQARLPLAASDGALASQTARDIQNLIDDMFPTEGGAPSGLSVSAVPRHSQECSAWNNVLGHVCLGRLVTNYHVFNVCL